SDGAAHRAFDKGEALVANEHGSSQHADRRAGIEPMFYHDRSLRLRLVDLVWGPCERDQVSLGLSGADPIPGLALGHVLLPDLVQALPRLHLALGSIEDHADPVFAVEKLDVVKYIALGRVG